MSPHLHTIHDVRLSLSFRHFTFYFSLLFSFLFLSFFLMSGYDYVSVTNNLRNSANGTFVTLDDFSPLTSLEYKATVQEEVMNFYAASQSLELVGTVQDTIPEALHK